MKLLFLLVAFCLTFSFQAQVMSLNGVAVTPTNGPCGAGNCKTVNSANTSGNCVTFTTGAFQNGAIWACTGINLNQSFKLTFTINFGTNTASGDGMAFLLQTEGVPGVIGGRGGGLGYAQGDGSNCQSAPCPISPSVAVEFDTYDNSPAAAGGLNDIAADHTSIQTNGIMTSGNTLSGPASLLTSGATVKDGTAHNVCITWDPALNRYTVFFDGVQRMQYNGNIRSLFTDPTNVYWGFTGASGGAAQTQSICSAAMLTNIASPSCSCTAPVATATPNPQTICSGNATGVTLTSTVVGTTYSWQATSNTSVGGESTTAQSGATITDVLTNSTTTSQIVNYTVTPTASGCVGAAITVPVTVNPLPVMTSSTTSTICSGVSVGLALTSTPTATSYSWIATANANVGGESTTAQSSSTISDVLTNTTTSVQMVTYTVTPTLNGCTSTAQTVTVTVNPIPVMTSASAITKCSGSAVGLALTSTPTATSYSWIATANANVGGESTTAQSSSTISDILTNTITSVQTVTYTVTPTLNGCAGTPQTVTVSVNPIILTPTVTTTAATCSANGTASISNYDPTATYVFSPVGPTAGSTITGMTPGTNYTVTASNGSCSSTASSSFSVAAQLIVPSTPTITTTPATCSANGIATINNYSGTLTYTFTPTGPTAGSTISGMTPGTSYTVSASNGSCSSTASSSFSVAAQLIVPSTPTITTTAATCSANGTASISNYDPTATYVFSPVGPTSGSTITGMTPGTSYTLTAGNGSCTSASSTLFSITAQLTQPSTPTITTTPATCSANGIATINNYSGTLTYTFTPTGPTAGSTITGLTPGTNYTVTASNGSCSSTASTSFSIAAQLTVPSTPTVTTTAATCSANGTASISNYDPTATYVFSPVGPTAGSTITGMTPGTSYTLTAGNGSCTSSASSSFSIAAQLTQPSTPTITTTPATCSANGIATITNYSGTLSYTFSPTGPTAGSTITGLTPGTNYTVTASNGSCSSTASASFSVAAQLIVPSTPTITTTPPTCLANGSASISNYDPTATYTFSPVGPTAGSTITGLTPGTNYTVTANNGTCTSTASSSFSIAAQLTVPSTPTITTAAATCSANGIATITNYSGTLSYTFAPSGPTAGATISGMTPGTSYTVSASNGSCSSTSSASFSIDAQLATPIISLTSNDPSTCNLNDGSILVTGSGTGILNWSGSTNGSISSASLNYTITSLGAGNYDVYYVDGTTGCQSATLSTALINPGAPILNNPGSQTACNSYTLPTITGTILSGNQAYYSNSQANGGTIISGPITSTQTVYIYDENGTCSDEESFVVTINNTPVIINPGPQSACVVYSLPTITGSNLSGSQAYYSNSQANGGAVISGSITSNQTVYIYDSNGSCSDEESFEITINPEPTLLSFNGGSTYCQGDVISDLIATVNGLPNYTLYYSINGIAQAPATSSSSNFNLGTNSGVYVLDSISDLNCINNTLTSSQTITVNPIPVAPLAGTDTTYCSNANPVDLIASGNGTFTWYDDNNSILGTGATYTPTMNLGTTNYNVSQTENGCEGPVASVLIIVQECGIIISSAFTPDNDNANDVWLLENIDQIYPKNVVTIYNRWGNVIYQSKAGQYELDPWDGTYNNEKMPVGSYYFIIEYNDNLTESSNGMVTIIK